MNGDLDVDDVINRTREVEQAARQQAAGTHAEAAREHCLGKADAARDLRRWIEINTGRH